MNTALLGFRPRTLQPQNVRRGGMMERETDKQRRNADSLYQGARSEHAAGEDGGGASEGVQYSLHLMRRSLRYRTAHRRLLRLQAIFVV